MPKYFCSVSGPRLGLDQRVRQSTELLDGVGGYREGFSRHAMQERFRREVRDPPWGQGVQRQQSLKYPVVS